MLTVLVAVAILSLPPVHWRLIGWVKGEAYYQGRPTSYWDGEIQKRYVFRQQRCGGLGGECGTVFEYWQRDPSAWEEWAEKTLGVAVPGDSSVTFSIAEEEAVSVLLELFINSANVKVRCFAADKLHFDGSDHWKAAASEDQNVRRAAIAGWQKRMEELSPP